MDLALEEIGVGEKVSVKACSSKHKNFAEFKGKLSSLTPSPIILEADDYGYERYFILVFSIKVANEVDGLAASNNVKFHSLPYTGKPLENLQRIQKEIEKIKNQKAEIKDRAANLAQREKELQLLYDRLLIQKTRFETSNLLSRTDKTVVIAGWCPEKFIEALKQGLNKISPTLEVVVRSPVKNEKAPVIIENRLTEPFEAITDIYGMPSYRELDPTPYLAPFFFLFFGLALTDAGYGIVLSILSLHMHKKTENPGARKLFRLLFLGGVSTFILGVATGSWFGNFFNRFSLTLLDRITAMALVINPLEEPVLMLVIVLALGFVQVFFGTGLRAYKTYIEGRWRDAVSNGIFLFVLLSLGLMLFGGKAAELGRWAFLGSTGLLFISAGVKGGFVFLYRLLGYLGDVLSYSRLLALGLATAVIAIVVNEIASMAFSIPYVGFIVGVIALIVGHSFNMAINILGAFVHSSRLQFVEFFTKFLEGGGRVFKPFTVKTKYTEVKKW